MFKKSVNSYYLKAVMPNHEQVKQDVLSLIKNSYDDNLSGSDQFYENEISKLDYSKHDDMTRPWVKRILPELLEQISQMTYSLGYLNIHMKALWYQQYKQNDIHDWHIHGENFTGVYYLELPEGSPATKLYDNGEIFTPPLSEGDICIFPSITPHIAPKILGDVRKTIISYNFNVMELNANKLSEIRNA